MNKPDLSRVAETFLRVTADDPSPADWPRYIQMLRTQVTPLVRQRRQQGHIRWFSFLFHNRCSGVPVDDPDDRGWFIHLRVELAEGVTIEQLRDTLPEDWWKGKTQLSPPLDRSCLDEIPASAFRDGDVANGWQVLGEVSEWSLSMLDAHPDGAAVPPQNLRKFLHFLWNQLLVDLVGCPRW